MDREKIGAELAKPLDRKHVKPQKANGPKGDYIEAWHAIAEANRIFGWDGWTRETVDMVCVSERERKIGQAQADGWGVTYRAKVRVMVGGVVKEGTGAGHGVDRDLGQAHESAAKEAESDAMKRALIMFGWPFGLALYDKGRENVSDDPNAEERFEQDVAREVKKIKTITSLDELVSYWKALNGTQYAVAADSRVIKAKDERKAALTTEEKDEAA